MKSHLKRIAVPRTWPLLRKTSTFTTRAHPGRKIELSLPLSVLMKEVLDIGVRTTKEAKKIVDAGRLLIDNKVVRDYRRPVGLMDTLSVPETDQHFRIVLDGRGKLTALAIDPKEAGRKAVKIERKTMLPKQRLQATLSDGRNLLTDKDYKVGDTLILEVPSQKVIKHLPLKEGQYAYLTGGKHIGKHGKITSIDGNQVRYQGKEEEALTLASYAMVVGAKGPEITIEEASK